MILILYVEEHLLKVYILNKYKIYYFIVFVEEHLLVFLLKSLKNMIRIFNKNYYLKISALFIF